MNQPLQTEYECNQCGHKEVKELTVYGQTAIAFPMFDCPECDGMLVVDMPEPKEIQ